MNGWRVTYGAPFPGWRDFPDVHRALEFAETAHAENPTITTTPETLRQLLADAWVRGYLDSWAQERGEALPTTEQPEIPWHLTENLSEWNPYRTETQA